MPIDSRNKRSAAMNTGSPWRSQLPVPDGSINAQDRQHASFLYRFLASVPGVGWLLMLRRKAAAEG